MAKARGRRRAVHKKARKTTSRHHAQKHPDKHVGQKARTRTVNAPGAAW